MLKYSEKARKKTCTKKLKDIQVWIELYVQTRQDKGTFKLGSSLAISTQTILSLSSFKITKYFFKETGRSRPVFFQ